MVSAATAELVAACLSRVPAGRPASAEELGEWLRFVARRNRTAAELLAA